MEPDRKRNRGPEEGVTKRPKLEDSPSSEHEIMLHATYDDELLSSPVTLTMLSHSSIRMRCYQW